VRKGADLLLRPKHPLHRRYEALRAYLVEGLSPREVQRRFGYSPSSIHVLAVRFRKEGVTPYFRDFLRRGPRDRPVVSPLRDEILELRRQGLSGRDIAERLTSQGRPISHPTVWLVLKEEGIGRLPRRTRAQRAAPPKDPPPVADLEELDLSPGREAACRAPLLLLFAPYLATLDFDRKVSRAGFTGTRMIPRISYVQALLALKLLHRRRKVQVMPIAEDEGFGLFAGLNVLPKTTALSDFSYLFGPRETRRLLSSVVKAREGMGAYPTRTFNLDFHPIPHHGDPEVSRLEHNFATRRGKAVPSVLAAFAQELDGREMVYSQANVVLEEMAEEVLRFVEYWRGITGEYPQEVVFDAHMTTHRVLAELDRRGITFLTLRERQPKEVTRLRGLPEEAWTTVTVETEGRKFPTPKVVEERVEIRDYPGTIRQIAAKDLGKENPMLLLTNDRRRGPGALLTRYARRTLIENGIGDQVQFFHVDALSSSVRIKVDLDAALSVVASGAYRWLGTQLRGYESAKARRVWEMFLDRPGWVELTETEVVVKVPRFSRAPVLLESPVCRNPAPIPWLGGRTLRVEVTRRKKPTGW
jgi:transposase